MCVAGTTALAYCWDSHGTSHIKFGETFKNIVKVLCSHWFLIYNGSWTLAQLRVQFYCILARKHEQSHVVPSTCIYTYDWLHLYTSASLLIHTWIVCVNVDMYMYISSQTCGTVGRASILSLRILTASSSDRDADHVWGMGEIVMIDMSRNMNITVVNTHAHLHVEVRNGFLEDLTLHSLHCVHNSQSSQRDLSSWRADSSHAQPPTGNE